MEEYRYTDIAKATLTQIMDGYEGHGPMPERMSQICDMAEELADRDSGLGAREPATTVVYQRHIAGAVLAAGPEHATIQDQCPHLATLSSHRRKRCMDCGKDLPLTNATHNTEPVIDDDL